MVSSATILQDSIFFIKNFLQSNLTDPITSTRPTGQAFILTSYPFRPVTYPVITIKDMNSRTQQILGFQSQAMMHYITIEVRVWANTVAQRDKLADSIYQKLKDNQIGVSGTSQANQLHDFSLVSSVNVDEKDGPKSKVMQFRYLFIAT